jgi:hypothetical protein
LVGSQLRQRVCEALFWKNPSYTRKRLAEWLKV